MLDFFAIFSKGGIVLWYFQGTGDLFTSSVNALIRSVILQERGGSDAFNHGTLALKHKLDNEFELVFVVAYQKVLQLSYIDKFLTDIQLEFRDKYRQELHNANVSRSYDFTAVFKRLLFDTEEASRKESLKPRKMKTFEESQKSKKTVASMIENRKDDKPKGKDKKKEKAENAANKENKEIKKVNFAPPPVKTVNGELDEDTIMKNRMKFFAKQNKKPEPKVKPQSPIEPTKKGKKSTVWDMGGNRKDLKNLDFSSGDMTNGIDHIPTMDDVDESMVGTAVGGLHDMDSESSEEENIEEEEEEEITVTNKSTELDITITK